MSLCLTHIPICLACVPPCPPQTLDQAAAPRRRPVYGGAEDGYGGAAGGGGGAAGGFAAAAGPDVTQTLGAMGGEQQDEAYEAFVTSERAPVSIYFVDVLHMFC